MAYQRLKIARDCWWLNPSGDNYVSDEDGNLSTYDNGIHNSINDFLGANDSLYLKFNGPGEALEGNPIPTGSNSTKYSARLESTNVVPESINVGIRASTTLALGIGAELFVNGLSFGSFGFWESSPSNVSGVYNLTDAQKKRLLSGRIEDNYDYFQIRFTTTDISAMNANLYDIEVYYSGSNTWDNHETAIPTVITSYDYPTALGFRGGSSWQDSQNNLVDYSGYYTIAIDPNDGDVDNQYIWHSTSPTNTTFWNSTDTLPSGGLSLYFAVSSGTIDPLQSITRANLNLRMSLPSSGLYENSRDSFEVNGYSINAKEDDYLYEMLDFAGSRSPKHRQYGYFIYGAGDIVEQSGFKNYSVELNFLDPTLYDSNNGDIASIKHRNVDLFGDIELQLVGLPSGTRISSAQLLLEQTPNNSCTLYSIGDLTKVGSIRYPDTSGITNVGFGNGAWHHRGDLEEWNTFDSFFKFAETSGIYTYPTTENPDFSGVIGTYRDPASLYYTSKEPTRKNYYRAPIVSSDSTRNPSYYRDAVKISYSDAVIDFNNYIDLGTDFSLYFMVYSDNTNIDNERYCIFCRRGAHNYPEFTCYHMSDNRIRFTIYDVYSNMYTLDCEYDDTDQPILIWINGQYSGGQTTVNLYVHDNIANYFSKDWHSDTVTFYGSRRLLGATAVTDLGGIRQTSPPTPTIFSDYFYLMEFGYANSYIALEDNTSGLTVKPDYNVSLSLDKQFLSSRISISPYLENPGSGINWNVEYGSGLAVWDTKFSIDDILDDTTYHELAGPVTTAYTNYLSHPSSIYVEVNAKHHTDHPSGVILKCDVEIDSGGTDNWKVWETEFSIPSGSDNTTYIQDFVRHIGMNTGAIKYSDISNITLNLRTTYPNLGDASYYGDLTINSVRIFFDSYCVAATGTNNITLYTDGGVNTENNNIDLFIKNFGESNSNIDLYLLSIASSSGNITLYASGGVPTQNSTLNLYASGTTPNETSGNFPLFIWSPDNSGNASYMSIPLFVETAGLFEPENLLPLYIKTTEYAEYNGSMNLFVKYDNSENNNISLFLLGPSGINNNIDLFIRGLGTTDGAIPANSNMNLFMARDTESTVEHLTLYLAQKTNTNNFDMFSQGHIVSTSSTPLYIYGSGIITNNTKLYTHGY